MKTNINDRRLFMVKASYIGFVSAHKHESISNILGSFVDNISRCAISTKIEIETEEEEIRKNYEEYDCVIILLQENEKVSTEKSTYIKEKINEYLKNLKEK